MSGVCSRRLWGIHAGNPFADENVKRLVKMMGPLLLGYSMIFVNQQVDKMIVSGLGDGVITAMTYASVLSNFITTFVGSICAVLFTYITQNIAEKKDQEAARLTMESASQMITLLLPISVLTMVNAGDIVSIVFGRGRFDQTAVGNCALALTGYGLMFVPVALRELLTRFQYGYEDSKTPMINSTIAIALNIVLSILLSLRWGVLGVTLATSISVIVCAILNFRSSRKRNTSLDICLLSGNLIPWLGGAALCILISFGGRAVLGNSAPLVRFFLVVIISGLLYGIINFSVNRPMIRKIIRRR